MRESKAFNRWCVSALILPLILLLSAIFPDAALARMVITNPSANRLFSESNDFASRRFADPWDMSQWTDASCRQHYENIADFSRNNGMLSGKTTGYAYFHLLFPGYRDGIPVGRDGEINRISAAKYDSFSFRMYAGRNTWGQVLWHFNNVWTGAGASSIRIYKGWHTYNLNLAANPQWTGKPMGIRFTPGNEAGVSFKIDWMRLYQSTKRRVTLSWTDTEPGSKVSIYLDHDHTYGNNPVERVASMTSRESNTFRWNPDPFTPGTYYLYIKKANQPAVYSKRLSINRVPLITITNPDETGGASYASVEVGDPWDMNGGNDVLWWDNLDNVSFSNGKMHARTVMKPGQQIGEGLFHLRLTKPIDTNKYHRVTVRYKYDGYFDFGLGTMARFLWGPDWYDMTRHSTSEPIIAYPGWQTYTLDLKKVPLADGGIGWNGLVNTFRFDPLEVPQPWTFHVDYIRLSADDTANRGTTIQWREAKRWTRPTTVGIFYDKNRSGYNGRLIAKVKSVYGNNSYKWKTSNIPAGTYWIYILANDGVSKSKAYSKGPIVIQH